MDAQEFRGLQEAYMKVVEGKVAWDDPKNPLQSGYTPKEKSEAKRKQLGVDNPETKSFEKGGPGEKEYARHGNLAAAQKKMSKRSQQPKGKPHKFKDQITVGTRGQLKRKQFHPPLGSDVPKEKRSSYPKSAQKEQVDIYDIILSHLLDEGYAETPEAAQAIMVNMSEEWREEIVAEMSYQPVSKEKESRIKKQMTAAKKSSKEASKTGDFEAAARHDERSRAMKAKVKRSDLPY